MKFTKKDLEFLNLYNVCADSKSEFHNKFEIRTENKKTTFSQFSMDVDLFTEIDNNLDEKFSVVYPIDKFISMLSLNRDADEIEIVEDNLNFGKNSKYQFESFDFQVSKTDEFKDFIQTQKAKRSFVIKDLEKINVVKKFIGVEEGIDCIALIDGYFITSDRKNAISAVKTSNDKSISIYLPKVFLNIISVLKLKEIEIFEYEIEAGEDENGKMEIEKFYLYKTGNTYIKFNVKDYVLPNIFTDDMKELYDHDTSLTVNRKGFLEALKRISVVVRDNIDQRVFLSIKEKSIVLENKDSGYAIEEIIATVDEDLIGVSLAVSASFMTSFFSLMTGDNIIMKIGAGQDSIGTGIFDKDDETLFVYNNLVILEIDDDEDDDDSDEDDGE